VNRISDAELAHLELLVEVDSLLSDLRDWVEQSPDWPPARACQALVRRLIERTDRLRLRLEAPLVVATLGGTGTGKSTLINALVGEELALAGRERPTTRQPTLICRPDLDPRDLGIDPDAVHLVQRDLPVLRDLVLLDCPDPDTTEDDEAGGTNLARLRRLLPSCDVLLVTGTQQKYRSARVLDELASAARGARLVFVQTHADMEVDVRDDWREVLRQQYEAGEIFFVDSLRALADERANLRPRGQFGRLVDLLTRELAGSAGARIRRANLLDLVEQTLQACRRRLDESFEPVGRLQAALDEQRRRLAAVLAQALRDELIQSRRQWEHRLLDEVANRWGFSPFSLVLRVYQGIGTLLATSLLFRVRSPVQLALWGAVESSRRLRSARQRKNARSAPSRALNLGLDEGSLRKSTIVLEGYAREAGLSLDRPVLDRVENEVAAMSEGFVANVSRELQALIARLADGYTGRATRWTFEMLWLLMLVPLLARMGKNFFWDSWLAADPRPVFGFDFLVAATFWLFVWAMILLWVFTSRMRGGLRARIDGLARTWSGDRSAVRLFTDWEQQIDRIVAFRQRLDQLEGTVTDLKTKVARTEPRIGRRMSEEETRPRDLAKDGS